MFQGDHTIISPQFFIQLCGFFAGQRTVVEDEAVVIVQIIRNILKFRAGLRGCGYERIHIYIYNKYTQSIQLSPSILRSSFTKKIPWSGP